MRGRFGGLPGVDTAYYCTQFGYEKRDDNNVRALLEQMQGHQPPRRHGQHPGGRAQPAGPRALIAVGRVVGEITTEPRAATVLVLTRSCSSPEFGKTFAELPPR